MFALFGLTCFSQTVTIKGQLSSMANSTITLQNSSQYKHDIRADKKGAFNTSVNVNKGYYSLGKIALLYLSPGMTLTVIKSGTDTVITGQGSVENMALIDMKKLEKKYFPMEGRLMASHFNAMEPVDFLDHTVNYKAAALALLEKQSIDEQFKSDQTEHIQYIIKYYLDSYKSRYGIDPKKEAEYLNEVRKMTASKLSTTTMLSNLLPYIKAMRVKSLSAEDRIKIEALIWEDFDINKETLFSFSPAYNTLVTKRFDLLTKAERSKSPYLSQNTASKEEFKMEIAGKEIKNDFIREFFLFESAKIAVAGSEDVERTYSKYLSLAKDTNYLGKIETIYKNKKLTATGLASPQFTYVDINNKPVSLSSLKGNYVYIDVWATWCVPCIKEIPALKTLEEKYHSDPIKFVSISVDSKKDKGKWEAYVASNKLKGVQLFADKDFGSEFIKAYGINSIPRFILLDPDGKIISSNALRPSNPKTEEMFSKLLDKDKLRPTEH